MALSPESGDPLNVLSLCAGVGGLDLGLSLGEPHARTVCYVERDAFAAAVLVARMADEALCDAPIWDDLKSFDGCPWRGVVDIVAAGYPCQPFSTAGKRRGEGDPRHLWPDVARIVRECQPWRIVLENVEGHLALGFSTVLGELRRLGYRVAAGLFSAREVGAAHLRRRLFVVADADHRRPVQRRRSAAGKRAGGILRRPIQGRLSGWNSPLGDAMDGATAVPEGGGVAAADAGGLAIFPPAPLDFEGWERVLAARPDLQPALFGLEYGVAAGVERSFVTGNGVVPLAAALAYRTLVAALEGGD